MVIFANAKKCLKLVRAFQLIYDEFLRFNVGVDFKDFITGNLSVLKNESKQSVEVVSALDEIDGFR